MVYAYHDRTFFVESDDVQCSRMNSREAAKMIARNRQDIIAGELSRLAADEYLEDIMQHMRNMEARGLVLLFGLIANLNRRRLFPMPASSICSARSSGS